MGWVLRIQLTKLGLSCTDNYIGILRGLSGRTGGSTHQLKKEKAMLLMAALILGVASAMLELVLYMRVASLRALIKRWEVLGLFLSLLISALLGMVFGAAGLTVMIAGVVSTVFTQPVYFLYNRWPERKRRAPEPQPA
jgi:hypothetical protein